LRNRWTSSLLAVGLTALVATSAVAPASGAAPTRAGEECDWFTDPFNPACDAFDTNGDGYLTPKVRFTWPDATTTAPGSTLVATATGQDLFRPVTVTFTRPVAPGSWSSGSVAFATVTLGPGQLDAQVGMPVGGPGTDGFRATARDAQNRSYGDGSWSVAIDRYASAMSTDLPAPRTVDVGASAQQVTGSVSGGERPVVLQVRARDGAWVDVATTRSTSSGTFSVAVPTYWVGSHTFRAQAPETALLAEAGSPTSSLKVRRTYRPIGSRAYSFVSSMSGRWNACAPIRYAVNPARMRKRGRADLRHALAEVSAATGLRFADAGTTSYFPQPGRFPDLPDGVDIVVGWASAKKVPGLAGSTVGIGGSMTDSDGRRSAGAVVIDTETQYRRPPAEARRMWRDVMLHEVGHVIGLGHVNDRTQIMYPTVGGGRGRYPGLFQKGDLTGLVKLGADAGGCTGEPDYRRGASAPRVAGAGAGASWVWEH
jgi:hypothetical protein